MSIDVYFKIRCDYVDYRYTSAGEACGAASVIAEPVTEGRVLTSGDALVQASERGWRQTEDHKNICPDHRHDVFGEGEGEGLPLEVT
jgi:hypothetical protein